MVLSSGIHLGLVLVICVGQHRRFRRRLHLLGGHVLLDTAGVDLVGGLSLGHVLLRASIWLPDIVLLNDLLLLELLLVVVLELVVLELVVLDHIHVAVGVQRSQLDTVVSTSRGHLLFLGNLRSQLFNYLLLLGKLSLFLRLPVLVLVVLLGPGLVDLLDVALQRDDLLGQVIDVLEERHVFLHKSGLDSLVLLLLLGDLFLDD